MTHPEPVPAVAPDAAYTAEQHVYFNELAELFALFAADTDVIYRPWLDATLPPSGTSAINLGCAAHTSWAKTTDRRACTQPGRDKFLDRFEREVDPDGTLPPAERHQSRTRQKGIHAAPGSALGFHSPDRTTHQSQVTGVFHSYFVRGGRRMDYVLFASTRCPASRKKACPSVLV